MLILRILLITFSVLGLPSNECDRFYPDSNDKTRFACLCSSKRCDEFGEVPMLERGAKVGLWYRTSRGGDRLAQYNININGDAKDEKDDMPVVFLNHSMRYQTIMGFGGAMTDAAAININNLTKSYDRELLLRQYFGKTGIGYSIVRINMASCDFSTRLYSYDDEEGDFDLKSFAMAPEDALKQKFTKYALDLNKNASMGLKVFASAWSAPGWMKSTNLMKGGGTLKPGTKYIQTWANYVVKFIEAYQDAGIPIWGVTTGNEPSEGETIDYQFQAMLLTPEDQSLFVRDYLSPAFKASQAANNTIIMIHDDNRQLLPDWADRALVNESTADLVAGIAVHWYADEGVPLSLLDETHNNHPNHFILGTEACWMYGVLLGDFFRAIGYVKDIVQDLNHWVTGWTDWNMVLNMQGGPNWVENWVDAPILVDSEKQIFYKEPMFYGMAQVSKFILPGAVRIDSEITRMPNNTDFVAVENPDGTTVFVASNRNEEPFDIAVKDGDNTIYLSLDAMSINTVIYRK